MIPRLLRGESATFVASVLVLAAGVGIATSMVALLDSMMVKSLDHIVDPARVVNISRARNYVQFLDLVENSKTLDVASYTRVELSLGVGADAALARVECVTDGYFGVLGVKPRVGRFFTAADERTPLGSPIVISDAFWRDRFGAQPGALSTPLSLAGREFAIVGVAPSAFRGVEFEQVDAWILLRQNPELCSFTGKNLLSSSGGSWLKTIGRLRDSVALADAERDTALLLGTSPSSGDTQTGVLQSLQDARTVLLGRNARMARWIALGALLLLAVACLNVSGLAAARTARRRHEIAIRLQLGATRTGVLKELLAASAIAPAIAVLPAALVAFWTARFASSFFPSGIVSDTFSVRALAVMVALATFAAILSGIGPALYGSRTDPAILLGRVGVKPTVRRISQRSLIVVQIALSFFLVAGGTQFIKSVRSIKGSAGFEFDNRIVVAVDLVRAGYRPFEGNEVIQQLLHRIQGLPGVASATVTSPILGSAGGSIKMGVRLAGGAAKLGVPVPFFNTVGPDYFATVGTRIVRGRAFSPGDTQNSTPVAIVNALRAKQLSPDDLIGQCLVIGKQPCVVVVGISEDRRYSRLTTTTEETFVPAGQLPLYLPGEFANTLIVRTTQEPHTLAPSIASAALAAFPTLPFVTAVPLEDLVDRQAMSWRAGANLFVLFGCAAVLLSVVGLYSLLAAINRERRSEIGVRIAVGARRADIVRLVGGQAIVMAAAGGALGVALVFAIARYWEPLLFEVDASDRLSFAIAGLAIVLVTLAGSALPAIQAARLDPVGLLKQE